MCGSSVFRDRFFTGTWDSQVKLVLLASEPQGSLPIHLPLVQGLQCMLPHLALNMVAGDQIQAPYS